MARLITLILELFGLVVNADSRYPNQIALHYTIRLVILYAVLYNYVQLYEIGKYIVHSTIILNSTSRIYPPTSL